MSSVTSGTHANGAAGAAAAPAWRHYPFFDVAPVKDVHDLDSSPDIFKSTPEISTVASSSVGVLVADIYGSVHILNRDFASISSWVAHVGGRVTHMVERNGILVTLGEEDTIRSPLLKIWDVANRDKKTGAPVLLRSTKVLPSNRPHPVTTVALTSNLSYLAIGLGDGSVILFKHLNQSLANSTALTALPKARSIHESPTEPVTGLGFKEPTEDNPTVALFIVTITNVLVYQVTGHGTGGRAAVVDEIGSGLGCAVIDWKNQEMIIARDEAIYVCGTEGRGNCYAYEGHKSSIHIHLHYVVIVSPPFFPTAAAASATVRNFVARSPHSGETDITKVTVFEPENKYVAYSGTFTHDVREVISQWGQIYILTSDGTLLCLQEKPTATKLEMLYRKSLYSLALSLAKTQRLDEASVADIHRQYGDHLYARGEHDNAMQQFVQTIGYLQPSYVIRKFLDAQRIHNLVTYLQELHAFGLANSDHTTLLLNAYTKLKDLARLNTFIKTESTRKKTTGGPGEQEELPFDLDTAIRVCRQAGYFEHASYLARKYERHEDYLRIQIEDAGNYVDALGYLRRLGADAAESNLARYGRALLENLPEETTQLLIDLCTIVRPLPPLEPEIPPESIARQPPPGPSYLGLLALNRHSVAPPVVVTSSSDTTNVAPSIRTVRPGDASARRDSVIEPSISPPSTPPPDPDPISHTEAHPPSLPIKRPSPRIYFAHFVDHMEHFIQFLETVSLKRWGLSVDEKKPSEPSSHEQSLNEEEKQDQVAVWNTLLELYLTLPGRLTNTNLTASLLRDKAMRVLQSPEIPYDPMHALILCSTHEYTPGLVLLWERMGRYEDVLRFWMDKDKHTASADVDFEASCKVIDCLDRYGPGHPHLYPLVLRYLTSSSEILQRHWDDVKKIIEDCVDGPDGDGRGVMSPLGVVQVLSRNGIASVGLVREWLIKRVTKARAEIQNDEQLTKSYRSEAAEKLKQVEELSDPDQPRVFHVTRCSTCGAQLDLPSIHFMCHHSYHQRCLAEHETECPNCAREHSVIREIRRNNERLADQHDVFLSEVKEGGFDAIAAAFGRGLLNMTRPQDILS